MYFFERGEIFRIKLAYLISIHCCNILVFEAEYIYYINYRPALAVKGSTVDEWRGHDYISDLF